MVAVAPWLVIASAAASSAATCPSPHELDELAGDPSRLISSAAELLALMRACSLEAEHNRGLILAVSAVLASGDSPAFVAAARAVLATADTPLAPPPSPPPSPPSPSSSSSARKKLATWHDSPEEQQQAQLAQVEVVRARYTAGRPKTTVRASPPLGIGETRRWPVACDPRLYQLGLPPVAGCTPALGPALGRAMGSGSGATGAASSTTMPCGRAMRDHVITAVEARTMLAVVERTMRGLFHQGASTSFAPASKGAAKHLGRDGMALYGNISQRVQAAVEAEFGTTVYSAGSLFTRLWADDAIPSDGMDVAPGHAYSNPHVDKANRASYDYSALLYLNAHCEDAASPAGGDSGDGGGGACTYDDGSSPDFGGGRFAWLDEASDLVVEPRAGRLLVFTGGLENPHHAQKVSRGTRYVMGWWFTCHEALEYDDDDDDDDASGLPQGGGKGGGGQGQDPPTQRLPAASAAASADARLYERLQAQQRRLVASDATGEAPPVPPRRRRGGIGAVPGGGQTPPSVGQSIGAMGAHELETMEAAIDAYAAALEEE